MHAGGAPIRTQRQAPEVDSGAEEGIVDVSDALQSAEPVNAMTIDVEEHFQVSAFEEKIARDEWHQYGSRVEANVDRILALLADADAKATFFVLGCVAERHPQVVRNIVSSGHEVASHGYDHIRVRQQTADQFRDDVLRTKSKLEEISGEPVLGYRAASFSIGEDTPWAHDVLQETGHQYSSSVYPIRHDHYGSPDTPRFPYLVRQGGLLEIPLTTIRLFGRNVPSAGGGYFRLLPLAYSKWAYRRVNRAERMPAVFYMHPWEIDPDQPRVEGVPLKTRFRHYVNLSRFAGRLEGILREFRWGRMDEIYGALLRR